MKSFSARIQKIGINPYILPPPAILNFLFEAAGKTKGHIPVRIVIKKQEFSQTLVKYSGKWRLYLNTPMRKHAGSDVGDIIKVSVAFDPGKREVPMNKLFAGALKKNKEAKKNFDGLPASRRKEILRYIGSLKSADAVSRNVERAIHFLEGKTRFVGRENP